MRTEAMKYAILIIVSTAVFTILGLVAAWGAAGYYQTDRPIDETAAIIFTLLAFGGLVAGLVVGCLAAYLGNRFSNPERDGKDSQNA